MSELELLFTVRDTGIGIAPGKDRFYPSGFHSSGQFDNPQVRRNRPGAYDLAQDSGDVGGRIEVVSEVKRGSIFSFTARVNMVEAEPESIALDPTKLTGVPVLIVDDNATNRRVLADWLSHWGMWPVLAESGAAALKLLESSAQPIPLVLTDVHMPEMDGFELLKEIKINLGTPTVIMLTSGSYPGDVNRGRELGAEAYLIKPVRRSELLQTSYGF